VAVFLVFYCQTVFTFLDRERDSRATGRKEVRRRSTAEEKMFTLNLDAIA
jgi:hypothetical protein